MKEPIIVIAAGKKEAVDLCNLLAKHHYSTISTQSVPELERVVRDKAPRMAIIDLDTVPVDNRFLRDLKGTHEALHIIAFSGRAFHPELKESMAAHLYACLRKPIDPEELNYLVKSIVCNALSPEELEPEGGRRPL